MFARLDRLIEVFRPEAVFVLGDLVHGPAVRASSLFNSIAQWRQRHAGVRLALVVGNHDQRTGALPAECGVEAIDEGYRLGPWRLHHEPTDSPHGHVLAGHLHPAFRLRGRVDSVRLPAFWLRERHSVLPAFGEFTGAAALTLLEGDRVFVTDGTCVRAVPRGDRQMSRVERQTSRAAA